MVAKSPQDSISEMEKDFAEIRKEILSKINEMRDAFNLRTRLPQNDGIQQRFNSCLEYMQQVIKRNPHDDLAAMINELTDSINASLSNPNFNDIEQSFAELERFINQQFVEQAESLSRHSLFNSSTIDSDEEIQEEIIAPKNR